MVGGHERRTFERNEATTGKFKLVAPFLVCKLLTTAFLTHGGGVCRVTEGGRGGPSGEVLEEGLQRQMK